MLFGREILPILSDRCFYCHGQDEKSRKADLRLDSLEEASRDLGGYRAIVPGDPEQSVLLRRMMATDEEEVMPPPKVHKPMRPAEVELFRRWIAQGAKFERHWAFVAPVRPPIPRLGGGFSGWVRNPIDAFVGQRLEREGLHPSMEAPVHTLVRRVSLDVTGLPPAAEAVREVSEAFKDPERKEVVWAEYVQRLLESPHYGERMGMFWLDASRYSDTDGFQADETRTNWPWRDWVIGAFNRNQRYDAFTLEQFAGDLLPGGTPEQKLATCFHRNHMTNGEGGRDPEESRVDYVIDRVNTVGTLWLGLTLGCAQCHTHKFDPVSQAEYYRLSAFFNSINETGVAGTKAGPHLAYVSPHAARAIREAEAQVAARKASEEEAAAAAEPAFTQWLGEMRARIRRGDTEGFQAWKPFVVGAFETNEGTTLTQGPEAIVTASGSTPDQDDYRMAGPAGLSRITGMRLEVLPDAALPAGGAARSESGVFILTDIKVQIRVRGASQGREVSVVSAVADYSADPKKHNGYGNIANTFDDDPRNGWANFDVPAQKAHTAVWAFAEPQLVGEHEEVVVELRQRALNPRHTLGRFRVSFSDQAGPAVRSVEAAPLEALLAWGGAGEGGDFSKKDRDRLKEQFLEDYQPYRPAKEALERAKSHLADTKGVAEKVQVMVLEEKAQPRPTHVLLRGQWDKPGEEVQPGVLEAIAPWQQGPTRSRVELARWLTSPGHPLTARVTVNHLWQLMFGEGLVRTPEDFGVQGEAPTHPELLDWLAVELVESGWNVHHLLKLMATSATYRQRSEVSEALRSRDPANRLLARASRYRMPAWMLRDGALKLSGLLNPTFGGPPVRPYQPSGVWEDITMGRFKYRPSEGADQYRRTIYAFWRRSASPAFLFDSAQRRVCEVRSARTNTPLQALTLMNDLTYLESARVLAQRVLIERGDTSVTGALFERVLFRSPQGNEQQVLDTQYARALAWYKAHPEEARKALLHGQTPPDERLAPEKLAAATLLSTLILNLDEAISRE